MSNTTTKQYVYRSKWLTVRHDSFTKDGKQEEYDVLERDDTVVIIPLTKDHKTLLLNHYRYPIQLYSHEFPMGGMEDGETPEQAATRELEEETGIACKKLVRIGTFHPAGGLTPQKAHVFIAYITEQELEHTIRPTDEDIKNIQSLPIADVYERVQQGMITDMFTLTCLLLLQQYKKKHSS